MAFQVNDGAARESDVVAQAGLGQKRCLRVWIHATRPRRIPQGENRLVCAGVAEQLRELTLRRCCGAHHGLHDRAHLEVDGRLQTRGCTPHGNHRRCCTAPRVTATQAQLDRAVHESGIGGSCSRFQPLGGGHVSERGDAGATHGRHSDRGSHGRATVGNHHRVPTVADGQHSSPVAVLDAVDDEPVPTGGAGGRQRSADHGTLQTTTRHHVLGRGEGIPENHCCGGRVSTDVGGALAEAGHAGVGVPHRQHAERRRALGQASAQHDRLADHPEVLATAQHLGQRRGDLAHCTRERRTTDHQQRVGAGHPALDQGTGALCHRMGGHGMHGAGHRRPRTRLRRWSHLRRPR